MRTSCGSCPISTRGARLASGIARASLARGRGGQARRLNWPPAPPGFRRGGISSPARAYALAAIAQDFDRRGEDTKTADTLGQAAAEAARWNMVDLQAAATLSQAHSSISAGALKPRPPPTRRFARGHPTAQRALALFQQGLAPSVWADRALSPPSRNSSRICRVRSPPTLTCSSASSTTSLGAADKAVAQYDLMSRSERSATAASLSCSWRKSTTTASASRRRSLSIGSSSRRIRTPAARRWRTCC